MNKKAILAVGGLASIAVIAFLAFGVFGVHTAFIDNEVSEDGPQFDSGASAAPADEDTDSEDSADSDENTDSEDADETAEESTEEVETEEAGTPEITTEKVGSFTGLSSYSVSGDISVLTDGNQRFLRFENFNSSNGPDLKVYLRSSSGDFVSLGNLTGNIGDQNYEIPADVDLDDFSTVEIWCERFSVGFGEGPLADA